MVKIYKQPFAHGGDTIAIPDAPQPDGKMSSADGWTPDYQLPKTDPNYKPVGRQEMNGVFKEVTEALGEIQQFGFAKWQPITWPQGARVVENDVVYRALTQTSQQPPHADWADESAIGVGQTWQVVTASRVAGITYTNTTGRAIVAVVSFAGYSDTSNSFAVVDDKNVARFKNQAISLASGAGASDQVVSATIIVPSGAEYKFVTGSGHRIETVMELR